MARVIITSNRAQAIILNALLASRTSRRHTSMVSIETLRDQVEELSRKQFDDALIALAGANLIALQPHDRPMSEPIIKRREWLRYKGYYFYAVYLRE